MYFPASALSFRAMAAAIVAVVVAMSAAPQQASAQQPPGLTATSFLANPGQILQQYPNGGPLMITAIRDLAVSDPATLNTIVGLLPNASKEQKGAIGAGLAQAARILVKTNQAAAGLIPEAIARSNDQDVVLAFLIANGERELGTIGGGAGAGGGASGGAVGGQTNPLPGLVGSTGGAQGIPGGSAGTNAFGFSSTVSGGGGSSTSTTFGAGPSTSTTFTTTSNNPVSP